MRLLTIALLAAFLMGCTNKPEEATERGAHFTCIEGFMYAMVGHGLAPVFDKADRLPKRCPN